MDLEKKLTHLFRKKPVIFSKKATSTHFSHILVPEYTSAEDPATWK
jgi:hypothetical protein